MARLIKRHSEEPSSEEMPRRRQPAENKTTPLPHKETKAHPTSAVPLFLPREAGPLIAVR